MIYPLFFGIFFQYIPAVMDLQGDCSAVKAGGDTIYNTYTDFWKNPDRGNILGQATKVTGSDQTGASIYGFREDKRMKQSQNHWDKAAFKEYQSLKSRNPKARMYGQTAAFSMQIPMFRKH